MDLRDGLGSGALFKTRGTPTRLLFQGFWLYEGVLSIPYGRQINDRGDRGHNVYKLDLLGEGMAGHH